MVALGQGYGFFQAFVLSEVWKLGRHWRCLAETLEGWGDGSQGESTGQRQMEKNWGETDIWGILEI